MSKSSKNDVVKKVGQKLEAMFPNGATFEPVGPSPENINKTRFGFCMILVGVIALIGGTFPLPTDPVNRLILLFIGLFWTIVGTWKIDSAIRSNS